MLNPSLPAYLLDKETIFLINCKKAIFFLIFTYLNGPFMSDGWGKANEILPPSIFVTELPLESVGNSAGILRGGGAGKVKIT